MLSKALVACAMIALVCTAALGAHVEIATVEIPETASAGQAALVFEAAGRGGFGPVRLCAEAARLHRPAEAALEARPDGENPAAVLAWVSDRRGERPAWNVVGADATRLIRGRLMPTEELMYTPFDSPGAATAAETRDDGRAAVGGGSPRQTISARAKTGEGRMAGDNVMLAVAPQFGTAFLVVVGGPLLLLRGRSRRMVRWLSGVFSRSSYRSAA